MVSGRMAGEERLDESARGRPARASMFGGVNLFSSSAMRPLRWPARLWHPWEVPRTGDYGMVL